ncbi:glycoside hydrolase family 3 protein [Sediminibacterium soli]|uniref:glycoside hydrolase family 3 protein n=1 Tax=Sediminibacterium soli TaxID=2698829 RepID=UPI00137AEAEA|nr:glycoside hydrolase family 3 protein [Sediminibacterium soli]NCI46989.1 beta-glucosidase [Sediminibacterium soli]
MKKNGLLLWMVLSVTVLQAQLPAYKNSALPVSERVSDLLGRMTPEEKFWQLFMIPGEPGADSARYRYGIFGFQVSAGSQGEHAASQLLQYKTDDDAITLAKKINAIQRYFVEHTRLGIPIIAFDEALHGLVRGGATSFPQAIALAASWDTALMRKVATAIAQETGSRGIRQVLTPVVNIASDVRWGRTEETYGEDPFLASEMAVAFIRSFEQNGIITTPKHFIANVGDGGRDSYPIHYNKRLLEEIYFPPFKAAIGKGGARSVMTAYNSLDGSPATANDWLLNKQLKDTWHFNGFVISDASAVGGANVLHFTAKDYGEAGKKAITNGLDVIFQTDYSHHSLFIAPFLNGAIEAKRIDDAVTRVLRAKFELGLFEKPYVPETPVNIAAHRALAKEAAIRSMVLLKNEKNILPLGENMASIAVIGTDAVEGRLGGYSGPGNAKISILDGIQQRLGTKTKLTYAPGPGRYDVQTETIPSGSFVDGLLGTYYNTIDLKGKPVLTRKDAAINFHWTLYPPDTALQNDQYSVRWTGKLRSPETGKFAIGLEGNDGYRLYVNDKLLIDQWDKQSFHTRLADQVFEKDKLYDIRVEFYEATGNAHIRLVWNRGIENNTQEKINEAVSAARQSDMAIIVAGIEEGEFRDRAMLSLPGQQEQLIRAVAGTGKPVLVVLVGGSAITMQHWIDSVDGIIDVWYPGEMGGEALAAVLFGDANPAGRLPVSFPIDEAQLPLVYNHKPTGRGDDYQNLSGLPLFPFGYGLSYTNFHYDAIRLDRKNISAKDSATVSFNLTNTGKREGDEVVQLYIHDRLASVARPVMELKGFQRIHLRPGETKRISFLITPEMLEMFDEKMHRIIEPGEFRLMIGASSRTTWLKETLTVE